MAQERGNEATIERLLEYLRSQRNTDFTGYKRGTITRRVDKRRLALGLGTLDEYIDHLEVDPDEFARLFDAVLINVTSFFRDEAAWEAMRSIIAERVIDGRRPDAPIRVWSAGASSGQEAYSLAIILAELLGEHEFRQRVKIYGTDIDEGALATARHGSFSARELESMPSDLRDRYFEPVNGTRVFRSDLRRAVIFGRHDLVQDAPISRLALVTCRNTLMYFNSETQARILDRFHFALEPGGTLFLGQAETLLSHSELFSSIDAKHRIFTKNQDRAVREYSVPPRTRIDHLLTLSADAGGDGIEQALLRTSFDSAPTPQVVVDADGNVALINGMARRSLRLVESDVGRPFQDLDLSFRPVELRSSIETAYREHRPVVHRDVELPIGPTESRYLDIEVMPLFLRTGHTAGVSITFTDVTRHRELRDALALSKRQLESAYEELQSTNEELETTNEELQSTIEELETTNEELQSINEELETMNEELQSTNDELQAANDALNVRGGELDEVNAFLESVLTALQRGVVVINPNRYVQIWNREAEDLWGLRAEEVVEQDLLMLDFGFPVDRLDGPIRQVLDGSVRSVELTERARNRRGQLIDCEVVIHARPDPGGEVAGALLLMLERPADEPPAA